MIYIRNDANGWTFTANEREAYLQSNVLIEIITAVADILLQDASEVLAGTRRSVEERCQAYLNVQLRSGVLNEAQAICNAANNSYTSVEQNQINVSIHFKLRSDALYAFTLSNKPFGAYNDTHQAQ